MTKDEPLAKTAPRAEREQPERRGPLAAVWNAVCATIGIIAGLLPHVLHHVGLLAGAVLVTGSGGNLLFGALGLLFLVPLLRRLYHRFGSWKAPAVALAVFAAMFSLSAFVIGPAISADTPGPAPTRVPSQVPSPGPDEHASHHGG